MSPGVRQMRRSCSLACLVLLAASTCGRGQGPARGASVVASLRFDSDGIGKCLAAITQFQIQATGEPRERLTITCEGKQIAAFETGGTLVDWKVHYPDGNRLFARWERGTGAELTVFKMTKQNSAAKPIFDRWEVYAPEVFDFPERLAGL